MCPKERDINVRQRSGYVYQEKDGAWVARTTIKDESGKRRNVKRRACSKSAAKEILKRLLREIDDEGSKAIDYARLTFHDLADFYDAHYLKPAEYVNGRKVTGMKDWKHAAIYLRIFRGYFGRRILREITYSDVRSFRFNRLHTQTQYGRQRSITTVNRELTYLRRIFNIAEREGFIVKNPFRAGDSLISTADEVKRERVLTHDEEIRLLNVCTGRRAHLRPILIAALDTAMRSGELIKLRWSEVFFDSRLILIKAENSKTARSRLVAMTPRLYDELLRLWRASSQDTGTRVFGVTDNFKKGFAAACSLAGVEGFRFHDARHTAITRMVAAGVAPMECMKVSGHSQYVTFARYVNPTEQAVRKAAEALALFNATAVTPQATEASEMVN